MSPQERKQAVIEAVSTLEYYGYIMPLLWNKEDIKHHLSAHKLSEAELNEVLEIINAKHDCNVGINWDFIETCCDRVLRKRPIEINDFELQLLLITGFKIEQVTDTEYNWYIEFEGKGYGGKIATDFEIGVLVDWQIDQNYYPKNVRDLEDELIEIIKYSVDDSLFDNSNVLMYNTKFI